MQSKRILVAAVAPLFLGAVSAMAAGEIDQAAAQPAKEPYTFSAAAGASQMFESDIDEGGKISRTRAGLTLGFDANCTDTLTVRNRFNYTYDDYNFSDLGVDADPWTKVNTLSYAMLLDYKIDDTWSIFGGPMIALAAEDGADWGDSFIPGVAVGAKYRVSPDLLIGLGIAGIQPIEDDFTVLPILILDWKINDQFLIRNSSPIAGVTTGWLGVEGIWMFADGWEAGIGAQAEKSRFRLSDSNEFARSGVGQISGIPVYARLDWKPNQQITVSGFAGVIAGGNLEIDNKDGDKLGDDVDYDPAPFIGASVSFKQ